MISLISGGDYARDGYCYKIYLTLPEFSSAKTININKTEHKSTKVLFPSGFLFTRNNIYVNIVIMVLGFGLGLEIQSRN